MRDFDEKSEEAVRTVVQWIVDGDYVVAEQFSRGVRLSAAQMEAAVKDYGRNLVMPPNESFDRLDVIRVETPLPTWSVVCELWTKEEGRSDLSLELTVIRKAPQEIMVEIDGIHVL